jgi:prepilin-type N-terminal cleavage/methylation domain-containing protein/prepilin-type processing-associated H-X9-DG protein
VKAGSKFERGFTLIELLAVVSIVLVLASVLLPGMARAKGSGRAIRCQSNLRQVGVALHIYTADFAAYPFGGPWPFTTNDVLIRGWWLAAVKNNVGDNWEVLYCPKSSFYAYNGSGTGYSAEARRGYGLGGAVDQRLRESEVSVPSDMLAVGESRCLSIIGFGRPGTPAGPDYDPTGPHPTRRSNGLFCDGHVESSASDRIAKDEWGEFEPDEAHARRWNFDHEPHRETWW